MPIDVRIEGIDGLVAAGALTAQARVAFKAGILRSVTRFADDAEGRSKKDYLSGPRPSRLGVVTGRLRGSLTHEVNESEDEIEAKIGTNVEYGRFWEKGFHGTQQVRPHLRVVATVFGKISIGAVIQQVKGFSRQVNQDARPFLKPAIDDAMPGLEDGVRAAFDEINLTGGSDAS